MTFTGRLVLRPGREPVRLDPDRRGCHNHATTQLRITTAVTCPTVRIHPAIIAQAAATATVASNGRCRLGIGSGENLNEHILGDVWPSVQVRHQMLEEAVEIMRALWEGHLATHQGRHYTVDNARLYTLPDEPVEVHVSAFGHEALALAAGVGDGLITIGPNAEAVATYRDQGGRGPTASAIKGCCAKDEKEAFSTAMKWANQGLPGQFAQELALPSHYEQANTLVTRDMMADKYPIGPDAPAVGRRHQGIRRCWLRRGVRQPDG